MLISLVIARIDLLAVYKQQVVMDEFASASSPQRAKALQIYKGRCTDLHPSCPVFAYVLLASSILIAERGL